jgi:FAD/FMN-containing dehydrogenase
VHVGGHAHTGGYGLPGRAFGLFADHIVSARVITADGRARWYSRGATDPEEADVFYAVLGGSPGNFGVLTHVKLEVHKDADHPDARGLRVSGARPASGRARAPTLARLPGCCSPVTHCSCT